MADTAAVGAWLAAALLLLAGSAKVRHPGGTVAAVAWTGLALSRPHVRALGAVEAAVAAAVLATGGPVPAAGMALLYGGFSAYVLVRLRRDRAAACGCFGDDRAPLTAAHVVVTSAAAVASALAAATAAPGLGRLAGLPVAVVAAILAGVAATVWLARLTLTAVPDLRAAVALHRPGAGP